MNDSKCNQNYITIFKNKVLLYEKIQGKCRNKGYTITRS